MFSSFDNDKDFIEFWKTNCQFFAYYVILARKYAQFYKNEEMLLEYLRQRGLIIGDEEIVENLQFLMKHYYDEIRKRGTIQIIKKATIDDLDQSDSGSESYSYQSKEINGELLRLINYDDCDEFIFNFRKSEKLGWNIRNSSPLYRGLSNMEGANKVWSNLITSTDYLKYPLFGNVTSVNDEVDESNSGSDSDSASQGSGDFDNVLKIIGNPSGFGLDGVSHYSLAYINQYAINVNVNIDYEFTFRIKTDITSNELSFGVDAFDCDGNLININNVIDLSASRNFLTGAYLNQVGKYYFFRGIVYSISRFPEFDITLQTAYKKNFIVRATTSAGTFFYRPLKDVPAGISLHNVAYFKQLDARETAQLELTSWNQGNNLQFTSGTVKTIPYLKLNGVRIGNPNIYVADVNIKPCATNYSSGFLQCNNWIDLVIKNNNLMFTYDQIKDIMRKYLLPYDTSFEFNEL